jgi:hypothetical protein
MRKFMELFCFEEDAEDRSGRRFPGFILTRAVWTGAAGNSLHLGLQYKDKPVNSIQRNIPCLL